MIYSQPESVHLDLVDLDHYGMTSSYDDPTDGYTYPSEDRATLFHLSDDVVSDYRLTFESLPQEGVPDGKYFHFRWTSHTVYPGVTSSIYLYLPHGAEEAESVNLMVCLDGLYYAGEQARVTTVLDNLVHSGSIPITVGLFHNPGETGPGYPVYGGNTNRAVEYDTVSGEFARYLEQELFPIIRTKVRLTDDPKGRVIAGHSSGGAGAFSAAFHRPDVFGNVISHCGSFINIRGANNLPSMVRRESRKPIRVWHQSGTRDADIIFGSIPIANYDLAAALKYRRYESVFEFGTGGHSLRHGGAVMPETLRWIFRDQVDDK
ncbi:esterase family protein [Nocardioides sp. KIGAM211]|uniref:Esterase family protein n=1 Tax=Nocardioides luti TaxID=2761101 RepID=A0A7X0RI85_9ACTN|nr:alpha/beta hydrolase-fold protein [Nocardioides luti]MBB6627548.1 esterase family protein [Nocardioides luti]